MDPVLWQSWYTGYSQYRKITPSCGMQLALPSVRVDRWWEKQTGLQWAGASRTSASTSWWQSGPWSDLLRVIHCPKSKFLLVLTAQIFTIFSGPIPKYFPRRKDHAVKIINADADPFPSLHKTIMPKMPMLLPANQMISQGMMLNPAPLMMFTTHQG